MIAVVLKERAVAEQRVAIVPDAVARLTEQGVEVRVESGAGQDAGFGDVAYRDAGARVESAGAAALAAEADILLCVQPPPAELLAGARRGAALIGLLRPLDSPELVRDLAGRGISALAMELVPRMTRAQRMDALSSQATVAGYRAVLVAATAIGKFFPMLMTAAGTIAPARVLVLGAGVAGLQAIATARRLGAVVHAFDIRPAVKEQVESLGATFVGLQLEEAETAGGYAKEVSEDVHRREQELLAKHVAESDVVITTALVPGKRAPVLVTRAMVEAMRPGSVIIDLAAEAGGNTEVTPEEGQADHGGVTIVALTNAAAGLPQHASQMYSRNVTELLLHLTGEGGTLNIDPGDEITRECLITHGGDVVHPRLKPGR
ncbi:MAG: Re/Si-specific NAD(P)(+) transhydrogenase subunit alpha [Longimicrobiales bacterium]